jgi:chromosome segregation ATPase
MRDYNAFVANNMPFRKQTATATTSSSTGSTTTMMLMSPSTTNTSVPSSPEQNNHMVPQQQQQHHQHHSNPSHHYSNGTNYNKTSKNNSSNTNGNISKTPTTTAAETSTSSSTVATTVSLSPSDALALRRDGPELVIYKLRQQLITAEESVNSSRSSAAKAEAVILELKGSIRQLKRGGNGGGGGGSHNSGQSVSNNTNHQNSNGNTNDTSNTIDMQTQLDQAHAQLLTADMVRKELEDTLEAEQYTWDLREQEQERTIQSLQQQLDEVKQSHEQELRLVTEERSELQACLDEALKELEAVDAELQNNRDWESLHSLHDFVSDKFHIEALPLEEYSTIPSLSLAIREMLLQVADTMEQQQSRIVELTENNNTHHTSNHSVAPDVKLLRKELASREAMGNELRNSLKEAVTLLKPLQDAVSKGDRERNRLQDQVRLFQVKELSLQKSLRDVKNRLQSAEDENEHLRSKAESLDIQLSRAKLEVASTVVSQQHSVATAESASTRLRAKRQSEQTLKQMLVDAQNKFSVLQHERETFSAQNSVLQRQVDDSVDVKEYEDQIEQLRADIERLQREILEKDEEIAEIRRELLNNATDKERLKELEHELEEKSKSLATKRENERILNKSLKDALSLIKPLQMHLEEAENEKMILANQLEALQSEKGIAATIRQLEQENAALQDALEQMSQSIHGGGGSSSQKSDHKLAQELVELQSRYAVTKQRLQDASMQNDDLMEQLQSRDRQDHELFQELSELREKAPFHNTNSSSNNNKNHNNPS